MEYTWLAPTVSDLLIFETIHFENLSNGHVVENGTEAIRLRI